MSVRTLTIGRRDQATRLRELVAGSERCGIMVAVTSGKGGVGKTSIAVNLSLALANRGLRVVLADVDLGLANADLLLNVQPRYTLQHVVAGVKTFEEILVETAGGVRFAPGGSGMSDLANLSAFDRHALVSQLHKLKINTDIVVLDCGAGISQNVVGFALASDVVYVVTTPQPTAITDAYAMIKTLHLAHCDAALSLIVNMARTRAEAATAFTRIAQVAARFLNYSVADGGCLLHDTAVEQAVLARCPFVRQTPTSKAGACVAAMAAELVRDQALTPTRREGLLKRVAGLFA